MKMQNKISFLIILLSLCFINSQAQDTYSSSSLNKALNLSSYDGSIISPQVALMQQYVNYPVNLSNGLADISIPVYDVKSKNLSMPLVLRFHASGLRADEREGSLGLRWALDAGGYVSRKVKGYPDDNIYNFSQLAKQGPGYTPDLITLYGTTRTSDYINTTFQSQLTFLPDYFSKFGKYEDTEYDIFTYSLPTGKSGKFILKDSAGVKIPQTMPYEPIKIEFLTDNTRYHTLRITDENGVVFNFGRSISEKDSKGNWAENTERDGDANNIVWHLNAIIAEDKQDTILINYTSLSKKPTTMLQNIVDVYDNFVDMQYFNMSENPLLFSALSDPLTSTPFSQNQVGSGLAYTPFSISSIKFKGGSVLFNYQTNSLQQPTILNNIEVKDPNANVVKKVKFNYKSNSSGSFTLLSSVDFADPSSGTSVQDYSLDYYDLPSVPTYGDLMQHSDWWGYYSQSAQPFVNENIYMDQLHADGSIVSTVNQITGSDNKNSDAESMKVGMVKSIQYPTGGKTVFDYESNYYNSNGSATPCGGLRVKNIENISESGKIEKRRYEYAGNSSVAGCGEIPDYLIPPDNGTRNMLSEIQMQCSVLDYTYDEHNIGYATNSAAKYTHRTYSNSFPDAYSDFHSNIVYYDQVSEIYDNDVDNIGRIDYTYNIKMLDYSTYEFDYENYTYHPTSTTYYVDPTDFWQNGTLAVKSVYNKNNQLIKNYEYDYSTFNKGIVFDLPVFRYRFQQLINYPSSWEMYPPAEVEELIMVHDDLYTCFGYKHQQYTIGAEKLSQETETTYNTNGTVASVHEINYDSNYLLPIQEKIHCSTNNDVKSINYTYPFNYTTEPYKSMVTNHILSPVIEKSLSKNDLFLEKTITNFNQWASYVYAPITIQYQKNGYALDTRLQLKYSTGNQLQEVVKDNTTKMVYINNGYDQPIAKIENASYSDVAAILTQSVIDRLSKTFAVSSSDMTTINALRASLPQALVTTYTYLPLTGMASATDPRGVTTNYTYDSFKRLFNSKNDDANVLNKYIYHYFNQ